MPVGAIFCKLNYLFGTYLAFAFFFAFLPALFLFAQVAMFFEINIYYSNILI